MSEGLKIGDRAEVVGPSNLGCVDELLIDKVGTITETDYTDPYAMYMVRIGESELWYPETSVKGIVRPCVDEKPATGTNPKAAIGASKLPLHLASPLAMAYMSVALANGAGKYGIANYKGTEVQASIYLSALLRHFMAFLEGEEYDPVDGQPHLGGILANVAIILDARAAGTLVDDRPIAGGYLKELEKLTEIYQNIVKLHEGNNPHHYTLNNAE